MFKMKKYFYILVIISLTSGSAYGFSKKNYSNYERLAVNLFLNGMFYDFYMDTQSSLANYESAYRITKSDYISLAIALKHLSSGEKQIGIDILNELYAKGFDIGRYGIYLYLDTVEKGDTVRSMVILDSLINMSSRRGEVQLASRLLKQKLDDTKFDFADNDQFAEFLYDASEKDLSRLFRIYFSSLELQFDSRVRSDPARIAMNIAGLENEYGTLPYTYYRIAYDELLRAEEFDKAQEILDKMSRITYGDIQYYSDNAGYFVSKSEFMKAQNILLDGIREYPQSSLRFDLAGVYLDLKEFDKAEIIYSGILEEVPPAGTIYGLIANEYQKRDDFGRTSEFYEKALEIFPDDEQMLNNYSYMLAENSKELEKALQMVEKALAGEPGSITYLDTKAWVLFRMGRYEEAEKIMDEVFSDDNSYYHDASAELFGHYKEIKQALNKSGELDTIEINDTVKIISEIMSRSEYILRTGF
jgi:tetratricopeptide (TPR) repeat protein